MISRRRDLAWIACQLVAACIGIALSAMIEDCVTRNRYRFAMMAVAWYASGMLSGWMIRGDHV